MTEQEKEIKTIRGREITVNLSDADVNRLFIKAGEVGLSVPELISNFIGDLVDGTYSNGSDERMYANNWFDRCWFGMFPNMNFVSYLLVEDDLDNTLLLWEDMNELKESLNDAEELAACDPEVITSMKEDVASYDQDLNDIFENYKAAGGKIESLELAMQEVLNWKKDKENMLRGLPQ